MLGSVLVANRGEIACRVMRTARSKGIRTVAVHSLADRHQLHVEHADAAVPLARGYLDIDEILDAAKRTGAESIHPGCGFLAESAEFARRVNDAGLVFIGPDASTIQMMGMKDAAKQVMREAGLPVIPGSGHVDVNDEQSLLGIAEGIGYPLLAKAVAGGGGRGIRIARSPCDLIEAVMGAGTEAGRVFGNDGVILEKLIGPSRHLEVQILADSHGNVVHLFERDCTIQRRNQKIIEETPAPGLTAAMRSRLHDLAVMAAKRIGYRGAGTIEFIAEWSNGPDPEKLWFMEMNTRLQVEHPVTEMVTGIDLVELQFRIADGERLPFRQDEISCSGHSIETRLCAEDIGSGHLSSEDRITRLELPTDARVDHAIRLHDRISIQYDSLLTKIIVHGTSRNDSTTRLTAALAETALSGPKTNLSLLKAISVHPGFVNGTHDSGFLDAEFAQVPDGSAPGIAQLSLAAASLCLAGQERYHLPGFALWGSPLHHLRLAWRGEVHTIGMTYPGHRTCLVSTLGRNCTVTHEDGDWTLDGTPMDAHCVHDGERVYLFDSHIWGFDIIDPLNPLTRSHFNPSGIVSPMPGTVLEVNVAEGEPFHRGQKIATIEAMKMIHVIRAAEDGVMESLHVSPGDQISAGSPIGKIRPPAAP